MRQGYPLAPLIFNFVVDTLDIYACKLAEDGLIRGYSMTNRRALARILQYTDDTVFFIGGKRDAQALSYIVNIFGEISGLKLNGSKSSLVCFGMSGSD